MEHERRIALKFAYDGTMFYGFQRQPGRPTVEGELIDALMKVGAIRSPRECGYRSSSRTDRGVSALGNVVSFRTSFETGEVCSAVNSEMEDVWAYSAIEVQEDFNPRSARQRWYRYYLLRADHDFRFMKELASRFIGIHDFSFYSRKDERNPMRKIDSIEISEAGGFLAIDFRAESYLWNMVRRIVWVINEASSRRLDVECVGPEAKKRPPRVGLARPEFLMLMDIDCGVVFPVNRSASIGLSRVLERRVGESAMKLEFERMLCSIISKG
ncbi:MAG: tRNA pseudouridine(38-40) synthase TruA [Candidatus Thermoplasmatota archaeon]|nr:tRNA pseudouridine(38-40) synthase TruA [Candidatus Thermoplasmatota archaeon]